MISQQNSGQSLERSQKEFMAQRLRSRCGCGWMGRRKQLEVECELAQDVVVEAITCLIQTCLGALQPQEVQELLYQACSAPRPMALGASILNKKTTDPVSGSPVRWDTVTRVLKM
jgi:hypothetical protein